MRQLLIVLLVVPLFLCEDLDSGDGGGDGGPQLQIYNGEAATDYKFIVHLEIGDEKQCGGTIYSENIILTTAQCVAPKGKKVEVSSVKIVAGVSDWTDEDEENRQEAKVSKIITHQDYKGGAEMDIALIVLQEGLQFNANVGSIDFYDPDEEDCSSGCPVFVLGWGGTETENKGTRVLQMIESTLSNQDECEEYWEKRGRPIMEGMFCTGSPEEEKHAWVGDEGGPVYVDKEGDLFLLGLVSWGSDRTIPRAYDVNIKVVYFQEWIEQQTSNVDVYPWIELQGGLNHGVVLLHKDADSKPVAICSHGVGQKELDGICVDLGYKYGVSRGSRDYTGRRPSKGFEKMPEFGATKLDCKDVSKSFAEDCSFKNYPDEAEIPCFDGQQLAVQCTDEEWEFDLTHMQTKSGTRGRAMCRLDALMYGLEINVKTDVSAMLVNIKDDGVDIVDKNMKYRRRQSTFVSRFKDVEHNCLACVAMINGAKSHFNTFLVEDRSICKMEAEAADIAVRTWLEEFPESEENEE